MDNELIDTYRALARVGANAVLRNPASHPAPLLDLATLVSKQSPMSTETVSVSPVWASLLDDRDAKMVDL